jgi:signal peptidase I
VPTGQYFMMGDNRDDSEDSRYWGFLPQDYIKGRAMFIYFSIADGSPGHGGFAGVRWGRLLRRVR